MKKLLNKIVLFLILSLTAFSYNFPIDDPYSATIIGSATIMTPRVSEKIVNNKLFAPTAPVASLPTKFPTNIISAVLYNC